MEEETTAMHSQVAERPSHLLPDREKHMKNENFDFSSPKFTDCRSVKFNINSYVWPVLEGILFLHHIIVKYNILTGNIT